MTSSRTPMTMAQARPAALVLACLAASACGSNPSAGAVAISMSPSSVTMAPGATQQFTATIVGTTNTAVSWSVQEDMGGSVSKTGLYKAPSSPGMFHIIATSDADASKFAVATAATMFQPPPTPTVNAIPGCGQVTLSWYPVGDVTSFTVWRAPHGNPPFVQISSSSHSPVLSGSQWSFVDSDAALAPSTRYDYEVFASNGAGLGAPAQVSATTAIAAPSMLLYPGDTQVSIVWTPPAVFPADASWIVERSTGSASPVQSLRGNRVTSMTDLSLSPSTSYSYSVRAEQAVTRGCAATASVMTGSGSSAITQSTVALDTFLYGTGSSYGTNELTAVADLSNSTFSAVSFDTSGTPTGHPGVGTVDGYFTIPNVPLGNNFLQVPHFQGYTTLRRLDVSVVHDSRPDVATASVQTDVTTSASGLVPFSPGDSLEVSVLGTGEYGDLLVWSKSGAPATGATAISTVNDFNSGISGLIDMTKGDALWLTNVANVSGAAAPYAALQRFCPAQVMPATMANGHAATIGCASGAVMRTPTPSTVTIDWKSSQFAATAAAGAGPSGTPQGSTLYIHGAHGYPKYGLQLWGPSFLSMEGPASGDVAQSVSFANPLPQNFGTVIASYGYSSVPVTAEPTAACPSPRAGSRLLVNWAQEDVSYLSSTLVPLVQPVTGAHAVVGSAVSDPLFGSGKPVAVLWNAPATGNAPTAYAIALFAVMTTGDCFSVAPFKTSFWVLGSASSAVIPPRFFPNSDGVQRYAVVVRSYWWDNTADPSKVGMLFGGTRIGKAEAFGGTFLH